MTGESGFVDCQGFSTLRTLKTNIQNWNMFERNYKLPPRPWLFPLLGQKFRLFSSGPYILRLALNLVCPPLCLLLSSFQTVIVAVILSHSSDHRAALCHVFIFQVKSKFFRLFHQSFHNPTPSSMSPVGSHLSAHASTCPLRPCCLAPFWPCHRSFESQLLWHLVSEALTDCIQQSWLLKLPWPPVHVSVPRFTHCTVIICLGFILPDQGDKIFQVTAGSCSSSHASTNRRAEKTGVIQQGLADYV